MSEVVEKKVVIHDNNHIWIDGRQFVSIERFIEVRNNTNVELKLLNDRVIELEQQNNNLKETIKILTK